MALDELACLAVGIVVDRTAAVVFKVFESSWEFHHVAQAWQHHVVLAGRNGALHLYATIAVDGVDLRGGELEVLLVELADALVEGVGAFWVAVAVAISLVATFLTLAFNGEAHLQRTVFLLQNGWGTDGTVLQVPKSLLEPCTRETDAVVVVGRCAEGIELRSVAVGDDVLRAVGQFADGPRLGVELHGEVLALNADGAVF